ncbi:MAG: hypothetical protein IT235_06425 [Bacteroidia bacterium]|nr:hypothetical protein [Bacteroidia bacterium]
MKGKSLLTIAGLMVLLLCFNACHKSDRDSDNETQSSVDNAIANEIFNDVFKQIAYYADSNSVFKLSSAACDSSWITGSVYPKTLYIKFDSVSGCTDAMGINHKGKIISVLSKKLTDSLAVITTTFSGFSRNGYSVSGNQTLTNKGRLNGKTTFGMNVNNCTIVTSSGKTITWNAQLTYTLSAGDTTGTFVDDEFSVTGSANGTGTQGETFTVKVTKSLTFVLVCSRITSGTLSITPGNLSPRTVDFGNGVCDNNITVTTPNKSYTIALP